MSAPARIQLRRTKGWRKPENTVVVSRPSRWGNYFRVGDRTAAQCVELFRTYIEACRDADPEEYEAWIAPLRGKNLACFCKLGHCCHADVLLELASAPERPSGR
jgi:hypothetical protein